VYPAASLAESALARGATVIEVNTQTTDLTRRATLALQGPAGRILPGLCAALLPPSG
jgi:NAD-dependent deacetylase